MKIVGKRRTRAFSVRAVAAEWLTAMLSLHMVQTIILFASTQCIRTDGG
jgi:hypothetical protein